MRLVIERVPAEDGTGLPVDASFRTVGGCLAGRP